MTTAELGGREARTSDILSQYSAALAAAGVDGPKIDPGAERALGKLAAGGPRYLAKPCADQAAEVKVDRKKHGILTHQYHFACTAAPTLGNPPQ